MKTFTYKIFINATAQKLWAALTSPEFTRQYWDDRELRSEWKVGSPISLIRKDGTLNWEGKMLSYDPYNMLSFTFNPAVDSPYAQRHAGENISKVTYLLTPSGETIMLTILHEELSDKFAEEVSTGWPFIASSLKSLLETGKPLATPSE